SIFFSLLLPAPRSTLFPYTTLFRSARVRRRRAMRAVQPPGEARRHAGRAQGFAALGTARQDPEKRHSPSWRRGPAKRPTVRDGADRKSTRLNSSHVAISYAVFCLKK